MSNSLQSQHQNSQSGHAKALFVLDYILEKREQNVKQNKGKFSKIKTFF